MALFDSTAAMKASTERTHEIVEEDILFEATWEHQLESGQPCITIRVTDTNIDDFKQKVDQAKAAFPPNCPE